MIQVKQKKPKKSPTKEQNIYCFLLCMNKNTITQIEAKRLTKEAMRLDTKSQILWLLKNCLNSLNYKAIGLILELPPFHVYHYLMVLNKEFKVAESPRGDWYALSFYDQERAKMIDRMIALLERYPEICKYFTDKNFSARSLYYLSLEAIVDLKNQVEQALEEDKRLLLEA